MGSNYSISTPEEREKIKTLLDYGISTAEVARITGRSMQFCGMIKAGTYEKNREYNRKRQQKLCAQMRQAAEEAQKQAAEEAKRQQTRERIRQEAERAGVPGYVKMPVEAAIIKADPIPANPFDNDHLLMRIADSNDYTNALLNGIMKRLDALCQALGVGE